MPYDTRLREEDLKNKVARDWFNDFDWTPVVGNIDFCIEDSEYNIAYLWAEAKKGTSEDIYASFVQLIITIGKARTFEKRIPPAFLGAFDAGKIAFLPYHAVMAVFSQNDFNWNVTPSDHATREFKQLYDQVKEAIEANSLMFEFQPKDKKRLRAFIKANFKPGVSDFQKIEITRNNFVSIYYQWVEKVKPSITANWEGLKNKDIIDADFYLADVMSEDNLTLGEKLFVLLKTTYYEFARATNVDLGVGEAKFAGFRDGQKAHAAFWKLYKRPPKAEFRSYILGRRDLLVPTDVRQYTGAFFTPPQWVALSQEYLARSLGQNWQDEYYVWDCAAGTGNLLAGLTEPGKIWASTLLQSDVDVMGQCIDSKSLNLLKGNVFQFDFLNDSFDKLPANLRAIVQDPERRKKLVIYINPPYAEATTTRNFITDKNINKAGVTKNDKYTARKYGPILGQARNEIYAHFLIRIFDEIFGCWIGHFSTAKIIQSSSFGRFREVFTPKLERFFLVPAASFDNVNGAFPIGFYVWNSQKKEEDVECRVADVYNREGSLIESKNVWCPAKDGYISKWILQYDRKPTFSTGYLVSLGTDFENNRGVCIASMPPAGHYTKIKVDASNLIECAIYVPVRKVIAPTWLNDRDQFLYPADTWADDAEFQSNCLAWTLFNNRISVKDGPNHWIPFTRKQVGAPASFTSTFMTDYMAGKLRPPKTETDKAREAATGIPYSSAPSAPLEFSPAAQAVFAAGLALWRYYHQQPNANPDAALYDIKAHFQGRNEKGRMNATSSDDTYNELMADLRAALKALAGQIKPKVYEHGFLKA